MKTKEEELKKKFNIVWKKDWVPKGREIDEFTFDFFIKGIEEGRIEATQDFIKMIDEVDIDDESKEIILEKLEKK